MNRTLFLSLALIVLAGADAESKNQRLSTLYSQKRDLRASELETERARYDQHDARLIPFGEPDTEMERLLSEQSSRRETRKRQEQRERWRLRYARDVQSVKSVEKMHRWDPLEVEREEARIGPVDLGVGDQSHRRKAAEHGDDFSAYQFSIRQFVYSHHPLKEMYPGWELHAVPTVPVYTGGKSVVIVPQMNAIVSPLTSSTYGSMTGNSTSYSSYTYSYSGTSNMGSRSSGPGDFVPHGGPTALPISANALYAIPTDAPRHVKKKKKKKKKSDKVTMSREEQETERNKAQEELAAQAEPDQGGLVDDSKKFLLDRGPKQLIINYLPIELSEAELRALFEEYGPVEAARMVTDKHTGKSKGYGFVYYYYSAHARSAIQNMDGFELYGKNIRVSYAVPQRPNSETHLDPPLDVDAEESSGEESNS